MEEKLHRFKEYAVSHTQLEQVDKTLMRAIREPAGFAHVLVYGPSGVGKTTMIRQIAKRLNGTITAPFTSKPSSYLNGSLPTIPLLLLETRPPDGAVFNRADYYRTALKVLGEPFYERLTLVDVDTEQAWEKKGRSRVKTAQFNDSLELRNALEEAMKRRGVRAVILDEAQHLMKIGSGASGGKLLDQLDWIKSMTNMTNVLHILIGTYELLDFRDLSGQASRRSLDLHFPRYLFQLSQDRRDFQAALLALLKQVPLGIEIEVLMQQWVYFYERSIGCVGVLKDWLVRGVAAALDDGSDSLTLERLQEHALTLAQCERMAIDAVEGEQKLGYMESRREHLWQLLQMGMDSTAIPSAIAAVQHSSTPPVVETNSQPETPKRKRRSSKTTTQTAQETQPTETACEPTPKKKRTPRKATAVAPAESVAQPPIVLAVAEPETLTEEAPVTKKKSHRSVGQRKPKRDPVGDGSSTSEKP